MIQSDRRLQLSTRYSQLRSSSPVTGCSDALPDTAAELTHPPHSSSLHCTPGSSWRSPLSDSCPLDTPHSLSCDCWRRSCPEHMLSAVLLLPNMRNLPHKRSNPDRRRCPSRWRTSPAGTTPEAAVTLRSDTDYPDRTCRTWPVRCSAGSSQPRTERTKRSHYSARGCPLDTAMAWCCLQRMRVPRGTACIPNPISGQ